MIATARFIVAGASSRSVTSSTRSHGGPSTLVTCGANAGDSATTRRSRAVGDDLAVREHHDLVAPPGPRTPRRGWPPPPRARPRRARAGPRRARASRRSRGRGSARRAAPPAAAGQDDRQRERQPLALGQVARVLVAGDAGHQPVEDGAAGAGAAVGGVALLGHGLEVEQVGRRLRHQPDQRPGGRPAPGRPGRPADAPTATAPAGTPTAALERPQQRGLARAVAAHERGDPAGAEGQVDTRGARRACPWSDGQPAAGERRRRVGAVIAVRWRGRQVERPRPGGGRRGR